MRVFLRRLTSHDPTTFIGTFAAWAISCGCSLLFTDDGLARSPVWTGLREISPSETLWGSLMVADGLLLFVAIRARRIPFRAAITLFSATLWLLIGVSITITGYRIGLFTVVGPFSIWCGVLAWFAVTRWMVYPANGEDNHGVR